MGNRCDRCDRCEGGVAGATGQPHQRVVVALLDRLSGLALGGLLLPVGDLHFVEPGADRHRVAGAVFQRVSGLVEVS